MHLPPPILVVVFTVVIKAPSGGSDDGSKGVTDRELESRLRFDGDALYNHKLFAERFDFRPVLAIISSAIVHPPHDRRHARALKLPGHDAQLLAQFFDFLIIATVAAQ